MITMMANSKIGKSLTVVGIILGILLLCAAVIFLILDVKFRAEYDIFANKIKKIDSNTLKPLSAVENSPITGKGNGLIDRLSCWPDLDCPTVEQAWIVPMGEGSERTTLESIVKNSGYDPSTISVTGDCKIEKDEDS